MSRIGKLPITVPSGVIITVDSECIKVAGPKGTLEQFTMPGIKIDQQDQQLIVSRKDDSKEQKSKHGLMRSLINNMIIGVTDEFKKQLEINGVGYRANLEVNKLKLSLGFSHDVIYQVPDAINVTVEQNIINISGISKQQVGQVAAEIRALKKPEPYKGKGIKYVGERIIRKSGKSGKDK
jgi:large subunit ribosomal protein L6